MTTTTPATVALTVAQYAAAENVTVRTVRRYLAADRLPGARQLPDGTWMIPSGVQPTIAATANPETFDFSPGSAVATVTPPTHELVDTRTPVERVLTNAAGFVSLELAAEALGVSTYAIRKHRDYFGAVPFGPNGALLVPQSAIRSIAGI